MWAYHVKLTVGSAVSTAAVYVVSSNSMQDPTLRTQKRAASMPCLSDGPVLEEKMLQN